MASLASEADYVFIPEWPPKHGWEDQLCDKLSQERKLGQRLNIIVVAEGSIDMDGKPIKAEYVKNVSLKYWSNNNIRNGLGTGTRASIDESIFASTRVHFKYSVTREVLYYCPHNETFV